jgi:hypothetical protein
MTQRSGLAGLALCLAMVSSSAMAQTTEGFAAAPQSGPQFNDANGPDAINAVSANSVYLRIAGSSFVPRSASTPAEYTSGGCIRATAAGGIYAADVQLPAGADVRYVRTYFYNNGTSSNVSTFFTEFDGAGAVTQHTTFPTTTNAGYDSTLSPALAVTVDPGSKSYIMVVNIGAADTNLRFCGVRIQYFY